MTSGRRVVPVARPVGMEVVGLVWEGEPPTQTVVGPSNGDGAGRVTKRRPAPRTRLIQPPRGLPPGGSTAVVGQNRGRRGGSSLSSGRIIRSVPIM